MCTPPDKIIAFTFGSHPTAKLEMRWTAVLTFPAGATAETALPLSIVDGNGVPVAEGVFELAGQKLEVKDGKAVMTYADFVCGKHETALWLYRPNMVPIPGGLTFA